jgi:hypothetical protein
VPVQKVHPSTFSSLTFSTAPASFRISTSIAPCTTTGRAADAARAGGVASRAPHAVSTAPANNAANIRDVNADLSTEAGSMIM